MHESALVCQRPNPADAIDRGLTAQLAGWVAALRFADVPAAAVHTAIECILDSIGAGLVAASLPISEKLQRLLDVEGRGTPSHTVLGSQQPASATWAAFVNGCLMHAEDWDDTPHTSYFLAALLAEAEELDSSGEELITAWIAAYEVWTHLIPALAIDRQHNPTSVIGPMVAALGAGSLHHLDVEQLQTALGIAAASSGGLRANFGTLTKPMDAGTSARAGVQAVRLTSLGWTSERRILEGVEGVRYKGVFDSFGGAKKDPTKALDGLGTVFRSAARPTTGFGGGALDPETWPPRWTPQPLSDAREAGGPTIKAWPACFGHNSALTALLSVLNEPGFDRSRIEAIDLIRPSDPKDSATFRTDPQTGLEAKFSVPFIMAAAWLDGDITLETFRDESYTRIYQSGYARRVNVSVQPGTAGRVALQLNDGTRREFPLGRGLALRGRGVVDKFLHNTSAILGDEPAHDAAERLMQLQRESGVRELIGRFAREATAR